MSTVAVGRSAEAIAAGALESAGFDILWRNRRFGPLELDIVARRNELVVIAEVRFRGACAFEGPLASMTHTKRRTLLRASRALWATLCQDRSIRRLRIDVFAITGEKVEWIEGALTADDA